MGSVVFANREDAPTLLTRGITKLVYTFATMHVICISRFSKCGSIMRKHSHFHLKEKPAIAIGIVACEIHANEVPLSTLRLVSAF